jgi:FkbM family methyltransferase
MRKIFIDCGAHCGESILRAKQQFGYDTQVISFEAVPKLANELANIYVNDPSVQVCNAAVYITDGTIDINICQVFTDGSSILTTLNDNHKASKVTVPCFDLSSWITNTFDSNDYIILKLDIEGAEYDVLQKLIDDKTINLINELWGEWHVGHIINNLEEDERIQFALKADKLQRTLENISKPLQIWEAYYTENAKLVKRPSSLYE